MSDLITAFDTNIDYKYIFGRDNYTCTTCFTGLAVDSALIKKIDPKGEKTSNNLCVSCYECLTKKPIVFPITSFNGKLIVISGPMYCSKSTTTQYLYRKYTTFNKNHIWIKPDIDNRQTNYSRTHNDEEIPAHTISALRPDRHLGELLSYKIVAIDEIQFFNERLLHVIHRLLENGTLILANGLKLTALRNIFGITHYLLAEADEIISLKAICNICGGVDHATRTKSFNKPSSDINVGGSDKYFAVCSTCDGSTNEIEFLKKSV